MATVNLSVAIAALGGSLVHNTSGTFTSSAVILNMAALNIAGTSNLVVTVPASTTVRIELKRGGTYTQYPAGSDWPVGTVNLTIPYDVSTPITDVRLTRITGSATVSYSLSDGTIAWSALQEDMRGIVQAKALVVNASTFIKSVDPVNDRGMCSQSAGIDNTIMQIENEATAGYSWDGSRGNPIFYCERTSNATLNVDPPANNTYLGVVANQAARLALSAAVVNNACYQTDAALFYVLTAPGPATNGNWTALPAGTLEGIVTIKNPTGKEIAIDGPMVGFKRLRVNYWTMQ